MSEDFEDNEDDEHNDEIRELIEEHDLDSDEAERAQELIDEGLSEDEAVEIAQNE